MRFIARILGWLLKTVLYIILAVIVGLLDAVTAIFRVLRDKCQPR